MIRSHPFKRLAIRRWRPGSRSVHKKTAPGLEPGCGSFWLRSVLAVAVAAVMQMLLGIGAAGVGTAAVCATAIQTGAVQARAVSATSAAFGIFGWLEVTYFDVFLFHIVSCPAA